MKKESVFYDADYHIRFLKLDYLQRLLRVDGPQATHASITYALVLNEIGVNSENYPLFLEVLNTNNRWVIEALTEGKDLNKFFEPVIPTYYIVQQIFSLFAKKRRQELNKTTLQILLGYLQIIFKDPHRGYEVYPLSISDLNHMAKNLDESKEENDPINNLILEILRYINEMNELSAYKDLGERVDIATQAGKTRSCFYDTKRNLSNALSGALLEDGVPEDGIKPEYIYAD